MKNVLLGLALVVGVCACSSPDQKNAMSDAAPAPAAKAGCETACEPAKQSCCAEKAGAAKVCPESGKVQN